MRTTSLDQSYALGVKEMLGQELLPAHAHTIGSYLLVGHVITLRGCLQLEGHWEKNAPPPPPPPPTFSSGHYVWCSRQLLVSASISVSDYDVNCFYYQHTYMNTCIIKL